LKMMIYFNQDRLFIRLFLWVAFLLIFFTSDSIAGYDYIDINNPYIKKIPIAVPLFKEMNGSMDEQTKAREASVLLSDTLEFTGYFKMIDHGAFLEHPEKQGISETSINFKNWTVIGAELLITGGISMSGNNITMEMRLFDTFKAKRLLGKKYTGDVLDQRIMIRKFCNDVMYLLTGSHGFFNSRIAFVSNSTGKKEIYISDFDGYNPRQITKSNSISLSPAWSTDGNWLAYTSYARGKPDLYIKNLKENRGCVVAKEGVNITPAWVPGQFALAATLSFSGDPEIYMLTGDGKVIKRVTRNWGIDVSPSFSPDGRKMAFVSKRSGNPQIYSKDLSSEQEKRLTFQGKNNTTPSWSPKGDKIVYSSMEKGQFNVCMIGADGGEPTQLTSDAGDNESPTWSPDGSLIAFCSTREGVSRIYVMTSYGTEQRRLFSMPGEQTNPKWSSNNMGN
jgi:TolB protein